MQSLLNEHVLVLNRHWTAVHVTTARRALVLLYGDHAKVVTEDYSTHDFGSWKELSLAAESIKMITTPTYQLAIPEVIILNQFHKFPPRQVKFSRKNIYIRDNYTCQYCGRQPSKEELTIDHVVPRSHGGKTTWENVLLACVRCNTRKGSKLAAEAGMTMLSKPVKPHWLACSQFYVQAANTLWQKFIDSAYWNSTLQE